MKFDYLSKPIYEGGENAQKKIWVGLFVLPYWEYILKWKIKIIIIKTRIDKMHEFLTL